MKTKSRWSISYGKKKSPDISCCRNISRYAPERKNIHTRHDDQMGYILEVLNRKRKAVVSEALNFSSGVC